MKRLVKFLNDHNIHLSLRFVLVFLVSMEIIVCILLSLLLEKIARDLFNINSSYLLFINLFITALIIGVGVTNIMSRYFFDPIFKLSDAMKKVANGDYTVRLTGDSYFSEINDVNSGFNLMCQQLQSTEILQTDFVSNVSHEFKTPINAIEGYSTLLQDCDGLPQQEKTYVEKILLSTKRLSTLVGNILLLSKIENQNIQSNKSVFRLDEQIRQSLLSLENDWTKKEIDFEVDMDNINYYSNESLLSHVWTNLIGNAVKFSPNQGLIKIQLKSKDDLIIFTITDEGVGLSEETQKHIFDKFYQGDTSHKQEGNGLGLALVKRILTIDEGTISAKNNENGVGCCFTVCLKQNCPNSLS